jgi:hypothetical protein
LTSSAAGEDSQESDELRASFFSHYLASALLGSGDANHDGRVTLGEAFGYASDRTLEATMGTIAGAQHPTYRFELGGRDDLVLTQPGAPSRSLGILEFPTAGTYLLHKGTAAGPIFAELATDDAGRRVAVEPGPYHVVQRAKDHLLEEDLVVAPGATVSVDVNEMRRVDYARVVRKGGTEESFALSAFVQGGARSPLLDLGTAWQSNVGVRVDFEVLSLEAKLAFLGAESIRGRNKYDGHDVSASLAALHAFDLGALSFGLGLELGGAWFGDRDPALSPLSPFVGPLAEIEARIVSGLYVTVGGGVYTYFMQDRDVATNRFQTATPVTLRGGAGLGWYF